MKKIVCAAICAGTLTALAGVAIDCSANRVKTNLDVGFKRIGTLVQRGVDDIGESGFMVDGLSEDRGLPFIDIAYNLEESLPALAAAADLFKHETLAVLVRRSARVHAAFMLPDGGMDAVTGSRAIKWTYYGSRTSDGALPLWAWCAKGGEPWATRMTARTLAQLRNCTAPNGLLCGGPDYIRADEPVCVHHTFTHAKALAELLADPPPCSSPASPLPRERAEGVTHFRSMDVDLAAVGPWRATFSANDTPEGRQTSDNREWRRACPPRAVGELRCGTESFKPIVPVLFLS